MVGTAGMGAQSMCSWMKMIPISSLPALGIQGVAKVVLLAAMATLAREAEEDVEVQATNGPLPFRIQMHFLLRSYLGLNLWVTSTIVQTTVLAGVRKLQT